MHRRVRQACIALQEHGSVWYAKIATTTGFYNLDLIIIKATAPDDVPLQEKHVQELIKILSLSFSSSRSFSLSFTRRFGKTQSWRVALKCLALLHRLLRSLPDSNPFRSDLLWARSNGFLTLNPCNFRDTSSTSSQNFTQSIRSYARVIDEALDCISIGPNPTQPLNGVLDKMNEIRRILEVLPQLQSLIDRVMDCRPVGSAWRSFVVRSAMKQIVRDSFACYSAFRHDIVFLLDNLLKLPYPNFVSALGIYKKGATQAGRLTEFYECCREMGLCGPYEYPFVQKILDEHVRALESLVNDMWQLTESPSSSSMSVRSSFSTSESPPSICTEEGSDQQLVRLDTVVLTQWEMFEEEELGPLIQMDGGDDSDDMSWEALLEASATRSWVPWKLVPYSNAYRYGYGYGWRDIEEREGKESDGWKLQVYNDHSTSPNPFVPRCHGYSTPNYYGVDTSSPTNPYF